MKFEVNAKEFNNVLKKVKDVVPKKCAVEYLKCLYFEADVDNNKLVIHATDLTTFVNAYVDVVFVGDNYEPFAVHVNDIKPFSVAKNYITIEGNKDFVCMTQGNKKVKIPVSSYDLIPNYPKDDDMVKIGNFAERWFTESFKNCATCVDMTHFNKLYQVVNVDMHKRKVVALDGYRLVARDIPSTFICGDAKECCLELKTVKILNSIMGTENISMFEDEKYLRFVRSGYCVYQKKCELRYFDYMSIVNGYIESYKSVVNVQEFSEIINDVVALKIGEKPIIVEIKDNILKASAKGIYEYENEIEVKDSQGNYKVGLNPAFLKTVMSIVSDKTVEIYGKNTKAPFYIKNDDYIFLILPIKIIDKV